MYTFDSKSLLKDGKRWFPIMGEIHYSRYPKEFWKESLEKMKAGGVDIVSSYVIWIHHEEIQGKYDFTGNRDLHAFVQTCKDCKMKLMLRIGPWCHGEVRNGGFPDWLLQQDFEVRTNDKKYFAQVKKWYKKIFKEVKDFLYSEKNPENPIIGVQIENEYGHCGGLYDESGDVHMQTLQKMAEKIGFKVPLYTATGWGGARTGGMLPVMGGYCDAPWDQRTTEIEPSGNFIFTYERNDHNIGSDHGLGYGITFDVKKFPYLTAELGGGLQVTKHRRTAAKDGDIGAMSLVKLGSGVNLLGYYMYHGGSNPDGKLTTLQESKATGYPNDLPEKSYDFRAPVREFGQVSETFRELKLFSYFVHDFGSELCEFPAVIPQNNPLKPDDFENLRYSFRTDGKKGYFFVNNYVRLKKMAEHKEEKITLPDGSSYSLKNLKNGEYFFYPFNMKFGDLTLPFVQASPLCILGDGTTVFYDPRKSDCELSDEYFSVLPEDSEKLDGQKYLVLSRKNALNAWLTPDKKIVITDGVLLSDENGNSSVYARTGRSNDGSFEFASYPALPKIPENFEIKGTENKNLSTQTAAFDFTVYKTTLPAKTEFKIDPKKKSDSPVLTYSLNLKPLTDYFESQKNAAHLNDCFVNLKYNGESARLYAFIDGKKTLIADNFALGDDYSWEIGLKQFISRKINFENLELEIFAFSENQPVYLEKQPQSKLPELKTADFDFEVKFAL
jgi:beta-galactosidase